MMDCVSVQVLLEHGADPRIHADDGAMPEHVSTVQSK